MPSFLRRRPQPPQAASPGRSTVSSALVEDEGPSNALLQEQLAGPMVDELPMLAAAARGTTEGAPGQMAGTHHALKAQQGKSSLFKGDWSRMLDGIKGFERAESASDGSPVASAALAARAEGLRAEIEAYIGSHQGPEHADRAALAARVLPRLAQARDQGVAPGRNTKTHTGESDLTLVAGNSNAPTVQRYGDTRAVFKRDALHDPAAGPAERRENDHSVAAANIDRLFGTNVIVPTEYSSLGASLGITMDLAGGEALSTADDVNGDLPLDVDFTDPELRHQLTDLQWIDALTGESDRHAGNVFVKQPGGGQGTRVQAVDNDRAFVAGDMAQPPDQAFNPSPAALDRAAGVRSAQEAAALSHDPRLISANLHARLTDPTMEEQYRATLGSNLDAAEIDNAMERFRTWRGKAAGMQPDQIIGGEGAGARGWDADFDPMEVASMYFGQYDDKLQGVKAQMPELVTARNPAKHTA